MSTNSLMVIGRPGRFTREPAGQIKRRAPASPMVLQNFAQLLTDLSQKVNAIAVNQEKAMAARQSVTAPMAKPVESAEIEVEPVRSSPPDNQRRTKVNRSSTREFFD